MRDKQITTAAIGTCPVCGVGLCLEHRREQTHGPGGTAIECRHLVEPSPSGGTANTTYSQPQQR